MKLVASLFAFFSMAFAMACPTLTGTYLCPGEAGEPDSIVTLSSNGNQLYYNEDGNSMTIVADGATRTYYNFFDMDVLNVSANCQGKDFRLNMNGKATIDEDGFQMTIDMVMTGSVSLDGNGNLVNNFDVTIPQFGMSQNDTSTCYRQ